MSCIFSGGGGSGSELCVCVCVFVAYGASHGKPLIQNKRKWCYVARWGNEVDTSRDLDQFLRFLELCPGALCSQQSEVKTFWPWLPPTSTTDHPGGVRLAHPTLLHPGAKGSYGAVGSFTSTEDLVLCCLWASGYVAAVIRCTADTLKLPRQLSLVSGLWLHSPPQECTGLTMNWLGLACWSKPVCHPYLSDSSMNINDQWSHMDQLRKGLMSGLAKNEG